jgi:hypothetical protein
MICNSTHAVETRESILELLSDIETAKVSVDEGQRKSCEGEEYIDLLALGNGVQTARSWHGTASTHSLFRSDVAESTWASVLMRLSNR